MHSYFHILHGRNWWACLLALLLALFVFAACSPLTVLNGVVPADAHRVTRDVSYGSDPRHKLDIYVPTGVTNPPVVVFFYGGNWSSGSREQYKFVGDALASRGMLAVIADYRLYPQVRYPDFVEDAARAVAWTIKNIRSYGGDEQRLYVAGHSAGAYNAAMVALDPRWLGQFGNSPRQLRGWIGLAGPYNFLPIENEATKPVFHHPNSPPESQPLVHVSANAPATLLLYGSADRTVNPERNSGKLAEALRAAGVPVQSKVYEGAGHAILVGALSRPLRWSQPVLDDITNFVAGPPR